MIQKCVYICSLNRVKYLIREHSSAGSEHLPYKQGVTGSNPVAPTKKSHFLVAFFMSVSFLLKIRFTFAMFESDAFGF